LSASALLNNTPRNVPSDLIIAGAEYGLPVLPFSNVALHKSKQPKSETIECFTSHLIKAFSEKL
jgi:hypothetical protein